MVPLSQQFKDNSDLFAFCVDTHPHGYTHTHIQTHNYIDKMIDIGLARK